MNPSFAIAPLSALWQSPARIVRKCGVDLKGLIQLHWQGELALWRSILVCSCMIYLPLGMGILLALVMNLIVPSRVSEWVLFLGWAVSHASMLWWSRGMHQKFLALLSQGRFLRSLFALTLAALGAAVFLLWIPFTYHTAANELGAHALSSDTPASCRDESRTWVSKPWTVQAHPEMQRITASGDIGWGSAKELERVILQNPQLKLLELESWGGLVHEMHQMTAIVEKYQLDTLVLDKCVSACTQVFLAGQRRFVTPDTRFGFHRSGYCGKPTNAPWSTPEYMASIYYRERGVADEFAQKALDTPYEGLWRVGALELKRGGFATHWWADRPREYSVAAGSN